MRDEQLEAVARAIFLGMYSGKDAGWDQVDARIKALWHNIARAALEAAEAVAWQPIDSETPKETSVLLWVEGKPMEKGLPHYPWWANFTHWRHLPEPPK